MRWLFPALLFLSVAGCEVVAEEDRPDRLEVALEAATLENLPDGTSQLDFTLVYEFEMSDPEGIEQVWWRYALVRGCSDADREAGACQIESRPVLAEHEQRMREPDPGKTTIFVEGKRSRVLELPTPLQVELTYVLWVTVSYRGEVIGHLLQDLRLGEPLSGDPGRIAAE